MRVMAVPAGVLGHGVLAIKIVWVPLRIFLVNCPAIIMGAGAFINSGIGWEARLVMAEEADKLLRRMVEAGVAHATVSGLIENRCPQELWIRDRMWIMAGGALHRIKNTRCIALCPLGARLVTALRCQRSGIIDLRRRRVQD